MLLIFLDTETTGLNPTKHRTLQIAFKIIERMAGRTVLSYDSTVAQPAEVWAEADPQSLQVNGFTWEETLSGKSEQVIAAEIINDFNRLDIGEKEGVFICQNPSFDRNFFTQLIGVELQKHYSWPYHWLDLASMYWAAQLLEGSEKIKRFKESDLTKNKIAKHYGLAPEEHPHRAMNGVNHLISCYEAIFGKFRP